MQVVTMNGLKTKGICFSKTHIYRLMKAGQFPRPAKIGQRRNVWSVEEIDNWLRQRFVERDAA